MAIGKWIGFGGGQPAAAETSSEDQNKVKRVYGADYKQFGMENFGNTCYANSVLQALYFCHPFRELVMQSPDRSNSFIPGTVVPGISPVIPVSPPPLTRMKTGRKQSTQDVRPGAQQSSAATPAEPTGPPIPSSPPTLYSALRSLFIHIANNGLDNGTVAPRAFVDKVKKENELFRGSAHQDAHEFFNFLLNKVSEELEEEFKVQVHEKNGCNGEDIPSPTIMSPSTPTFTQRTGVYNLFEGVLTSETRCLTCENVSTRDEAFLDLSIDIEQNSSVTACLRQFSASEMLCQKNKFFCDGCCGLQEAEKRMKIKKLPNVLALHLKRFKYQEELQKYIKLAYRVVFPFELRLFNTVDNTESPDRLYELFAIIVHIGNGPNQGHYIAIVKSRGSWFVFDDDTVDKIKEPDIAKYFGESNSGSAYVLYYQAVDLDFAALGLRTQPEPTTTTTTTQPATPPPVPPLPPSFQSEAPLLPPGLVPEGDSSDLTNSPASLAVTSPPNVTPPSLTLSIPSAPETPPPPPLTLAPPATPVLATPSGKSGNFFSSLRHTPSIRTGHARLSTYSNPLTSPSEQKAPPVSQAPPLTPSPSKPSQGIQESLASSPLSSSPRVVKDKDLNGQVKAPKEKSSGWFSKRRSIKAEKSSDSSTPRPKTAPHPSSLPASSDAAVTLMASPGIGTRRMSEKPVASRHSSYLSPEIPPNFPTELMVPPREGSTKSTLSSDSRSGSYPPEVVPEEQILLPNMLEGPRTQSPAPLPQPPQIDHKTSQPPLSDRARYPSKDNPTRPHTANATATSHHSFTMGVVPVPLPSSSLSADVSHSMRTSGRPQKRPSSSQHEPTFASASLPPVKPPSRKLSLSSGMSNMSGMLGFGKKDKNKEKPGPRPQQDYANISTSAPAGATHFTTRKPTRITADAVNGHKH